MHLFSWRRYIIWLRIGHLLLFCPGFALPSKAIQGCFLFFVRSLHDWPPEIIEKFIKLCRSSFVKKINQVILWFCLLPSLSPRCLLSLLLIFLTISSWVIQASFLFLLLFACSILTRASITVSKDSDANIVLYATLIWWCHALHFCLWFCMERQQY